jgi:hypothetical protein
MRSELSGDRLRQQERSYARQAEVNVFQECLAMQTMIDRSAEKHGHERDRQRQHVIMGYGGSPEPSYPITGHSNDAGGKKISLQGRPEVLR